MFFILIISFIFASDLFLNQGSPATFDGYVHLANIAQIHRALANGEFPARWGDGFANYGMPIPIIAQQTTSYIGAFLTFLTQDVVLSYALVVLIGAYLSNYFLYRFLRIYVNHYAALLGVFVFNVAPYRIINIYIRGSLPEFFGSVFLPLFLIGINRSIAEKRKYGPPLVALSIAGILLTHPFLLIIYSPIFLPYAGYLIYKNKNRINVICKILDWTVLGFGLAAYFIIPLFTEIKYFYYGQSANHFVPNQYLTLKHFIDPNWYYNYENDIYTRGHFIKPGIPEVVLLILFVLYVLSTLVTRRKQIFNPLKFTLLAGGIISIFLTIKLALPLYENINFLGGIQHAWRMLSAFIFIPPMILALWANKKNPWLFVLPVVIFFMIIRFPQIYGKNYLLRPQSSYYKMPENLHGTIMNTIWTSNTTDYPQQKEKAAIFDGKGKILKKEIKNASRKYLIDAETDLKMVDYTFYYPGWRVYVDGEKTEIQFQDPSYRGVITYLLKKGEHEVVLRFEETLVRIIANIVTIFSFILFLFQIYRIRKST